jgi:hypothetical protein
MLAEHQVRHLLTEVERAVGRRLEDIRSRLRSESNVRPAIWELIVLDAVSQIGKIDYQRATTSGKTPDIFVETPDGELWIEAALLLSPRIANTEARQDAFRRALYEEERRIGLTSGSLHHEFYGRKTGYGNEITLPAQHELRAFFRSDSVKSFFEFIRDNPQQPVMIDLGEYGASVKLAYVPGTRSAFSSSVGIEQPREVGEHAVYRQLTKKAKKYKAHDLNAPLIVCIGSERSSSIRAMGTMAVSTEAAIQQAFREHPVISGAIAVSIETYFPTLERLHDSRRARVTAIANRSATLPLSEALLRRINLRFDRVDYGHGWNEWEGVRSVADRMKQLGGTFVHEITKDGFAVTLPAHQILCILGGGRSVADLEASYRWAEAENPFRRAMIEGRSIVRVELLPHDARKLEPQAMKIVFGPPTPLLLQSPKD